MWSVLVGEAVRWKESKGTSVAVVCDSTKIRIIELGDRVFKN